MIVEDRFEEPETVPIDVQIRRAYRRYLHNFVPDDEDDEPMSLEQFEEVWIRY